MQLKTLWSIILKTIGVYFAFSVIQLLFFVGGMSVDLVFDGNSTSDFTFTLGSLLVWGVVAYLCLFQTDAIIRLFKLEESIPEKYINTNIETKNVLRLAIAIIGIYSLSNSIPEFFAAFNEVSLKDGLPLFALIRVLFGVVLVLKNREIEQLISRYQSK